MKFNQLNGKYVLITGAAGGLGTELCLAFGKQGAKILALDIQLDRLQDLKSFLAKSNIECIYFECDITDKEKCKNTIEKIKDSSASIDIVIHNAGISHRSQFIETKIEILENILAVNINGTLNITHYTLNEIIRNKGSYIAISSVAGFAPLFGRTGYAASKHALHGFFETLRVEVEDLGVKIMIVCPSFIKTAMEYTALNGDGQKVTQNKSTVGNVLTPDYVAKSIVKGVLHNKKRIYISPIAKVSLWINRLAPTLYSKIMKRKIMLEFSQNNFFKK